MATINDVWSAFDKGEHQWTSCGWPTHYGSADLDLNSMLSSEADKTADHWRAIAADEVAYGDVTTEEEDCLVQVARQLRLSRAVAFVGRNHESHSEVCGKMARLFVRKLWPGSGSLRPIGWRKSSRMRSGQKTRPRERSRGPRLVIGMAPWSMPAEPAR